MKKLIALLILVCASGAVAAVQDNTPAEVSTAIGRPKNYKAKALHAVSAVTTANPNIKARCLDALRKS
ncbi:hypothetical protein [Paraburkholderia sp. 40]|uniref:hypothetical protein n=1 Tax=Paraburkholderia sp. 40 TaxID=2991059 RepID=UPI003D1A9BBF